MSVLQFDGDPNSVAYLKPWDADAEAFTMSLTASLTDHTPATRRDILTEDASGFDLYVEDDDLHIDMGGDLTVAAGAFADDDEHEVQVNFNDSILTVIIDGEQAGQYTPVGTPGEWTWTIGSSWIGTIRALGINDERLYGMNEGFGYTLYDAIGLIHGAIDFDFAGGWTEDSTALTTLVELNMVFGTANIQRWADLDNDKSASFISDRIAWAISSASDDVRDELGEALYELTITNSTIRRLTAMLAGVQLYESRGIEDWDPETGRAVHRLKYVADRASMMMRKIKAGIIKLSTEPKHTMAPEVYDLGSYSAGTSDGDSSSTSS